MSGADGDHRGAARRRRADISVLVAYGALTLLFTWPLALHLTDSARDWGDPFLNAWIMGWQLERWAALDFSGYFDANVFYPHLNTLAYSEFLVPQTLLAAPVYYLTGNALLGHNIMMLLGFITNAYSAYLLVNYLTDDRAAAFVGGFVFAFNPFVYDHLSHLQVITAAGLPLSFLLLHRYFDTGAFRYMAMFTATYVAQSLANAYYAVYLTYAAGAFILYKAVIGRRLTDLRMWGHLTVHTIVSAALIAPFFLQYLELRDSMGFFRTMGQVVGWPFLAVPQINRLYGGLMRNWANPEAKLFLGFMTSLLVLVGVAWVLRERVNRVDVGPSDRVRTAYRVLGWIALAAGLVIIAIATTGGVRTSVLGIPLRASTYSNPTTVLVACVAARELLRRRHERLRELARNALGDEVFYVAMLVTVMVLSMGARGPYRLLYEYAPGFNAIRAVSRIHVLTTVAAAVLAGIAIQRLRAHVAWLAHPAALVALSAVIGIEYVSIPVPLYAADPPHYVERQWLPERPGDYAVIYYPTVPEHDPMRMYHSLLHGRNIVNGLSGFPAPVYARLRARGFPSENMLDDFEALGLRYVIVDQAYYHERDIGIRQQLRQLEPDLMRVAELGDFLVYELQTPWLTRAQLYERLAAQDAEVRPLPRDDWRVEVSENEREAARAIDGDIGTRWRTGLQAADMTISVDLGRRQRIAGVDLAMGAWPGDVPQGWYVQVSNDALRWRRVWRDNRYELPITEYLRPADMRAAARFDATARHVRVVITRPREDVVWSIAELEVLTPGAGWER